MLVHCYMVRTNILYYFFFVCTIIIKQKILQLKGKVFELLEVILEEIDDSSSDLAQIVMKDFSIRNVQTSMYQLWETLKNSLYNEADPDGHYQEDLYQGLYHAFHAIRRLQSYGLCK